MHKKLFVFGNEYLAFDSFAHAVAAELKSTGIEIVACRSPEELLDEDDVLILDVVRGATEPVLLTDVSAIKTTRLMSMHDFDLGFFLNLMKGMGKEKKIRIIGVPEKGDAKAIAKKVISWL